MTFLLRYWRVLAIAAALGAALTLFTHCTNQAERRGYERAQAEGKAAIAKLDAATAAREAEERQITDAHERASLEQRRALQNQVDSLTSRNVDLGRLRACADRGRAAAARAAETAPQSHGATDEREHDLQTKQDFGIQLVRYAGECEQYRQRLSQLQQWISETR